MSGFLSWISGKFQRSRVASGSAGPSQILGHHSRLLNAAQVDRHPEDDTHPEPLQKLEEHLYCWLLDASPRQFDEPSPHANKVLKELRRRIETGELEELPRQPLTLPTLMRTLSTETASRKEVTTIILSDASLTDQVLQVANSPYFKVGDQPVESVDQAVFLLGLDGIRNVASASVMRPMLAARNSSEALFAQRVWRWGLTCARSAELIALTQRQDSTSYFMVGLLPALAYITLRREVQRIYRKKIPDAQPTAAILHEVLRRFDWTTAQKIAEAWNLPVRYHSLLLTAERPMPGETSTPLNDGIILGTREVLRHAHQRNLSDEELRSLLSLDDSQLDKVRLILSRLLTEGLSSH